MDEYQDSSHSKWECKYLGVTWRKIRLMFWAKKAIF